MIDLIGRFSGLVPYARAEALGRWIPHRVHEFGAIAMQLDKWSIKHRAILNAGVSFGKKLRFPVTHDAFLLAPRFRERCVDELSHAVERRGPKRLRIGRRDRDALRLRARYEARPKHH